jgi:hypothetical protein
LILCPCSFGSRFTKSCEFILILRWLFTLIHAPLIAPWVLWIYFDFEFHCNTPCHFLRCWFLRMWDNCRIIGILSTRRHVHDRVFVRGASKETQSARSPMMSITSIIPTNNV